MATLHAMNIPNIRNVTNNIAACALFTTCSISNATPASVKKTKFTEGCKETKDECNAFDPIALNNCCCANLLVVVVAVAALDGDGGELPIVVITAASLSDSEAALAPAVVEKLPRFAQNIPQHTHTNSGSKKNNCLETTNMVVE